MAQWAKMFSGYTHETKVQDAEHSLRKAIEAFVTVPEAERVGKLKALRHLSERLLAARLKALRARTSALIGPGSKTRLDDSHALHLQKREQELQAQNADEILKEFGFYDKPVV
jgi:hypothetical protein